MAKQKPREWHWQIMRNNSIHAECINPDVVLNIRGYWKEPLIVCNLLLGFHDGYHQHPSGWRYALTSYVQSGWNSVRLCDRWQADDETVWATDPAFATRNDAIKAALNRLIELADQAITVNPTIAYVLCHSAWEPMWDLLAEVSQHDDWLAEMRAPKKSVLTEQLQLFQ